MMNPGDIAVLEMGEDEGGAGDVADLAGAGGDVAEGAPPAGEQGEPAFAQAAQYGSRISLADQGDLGVPGEPGALVVPA
jgi:hypothetical protein